ncbi:MAG: hypothetical protein ACI4EF_11860 [Coprococcus sp.]
MKNYKYYLSRYYWSIWLVVCMVICIIVRCKMSEMTTTYEIYSSLYKANFVLGVYILMYIIMLVPLCSRWRSDLIAVRCISNDRYLFMLIRKIFFRAVAYSFVNNFLFYIIVGTAASDWYMKQNIIRTMCLFVTQTIGWVLIAFIFVFFYMLTKNSVISLLITQVLMCGAVLESVFMNYTIKYYVLLYYFMFHIEQYPSVAAFVSVLMFNCIILLALLFGTKTKLDKYDFL